MELQEVLHAQGLEQEDNVGEVGALDLGDGGGEQLFPVLRVGNKKPTQKNTKKLLKMFFFYENNTNFSLLNCFL